MRVRPQDASGVVEIERKPTAPCVRPQDASGVVEFELSPPPKGTLDVLAMTPTHTVRLPPPQ